MKTKLRQLLSRPDGKLRLHVPRPKLTFVFCLAVVLASLAFSRHASAAGTLFVNPDGVCGGNSPCFTTIQAAINAAAPGDTINVFAGTYAEQLDINKSLTLLGPNANINPNTGARRRSQHHPDRQRPAQSGLRRADCRHVLRQRRHLQGIHR